MRTSEFISPMHPDKLCDRISDAIVDAYLKDDPRARCAVEVMGGMRVFTSRGEVTSTAKPDIREITRRIGGHLEINIHLESQSPEIAPRRGQGRSWWSDIAIGYACRENEAMIPQGTLPRAELVPLPVRTAPLTTGETQVTLGENDLGSHCRPLGGVPTEQLKDEVFSWIAKANLRIGNETRIYCNPAGDWDQGGFSADTGLTGRKIVATRMARAFLWAAVHSRAKTARKSTARERTRPTTRRDSARRESLRQRRAGDGVLRHRRTVSRANHRPLWWGRDLRYHGAISGGFPARTHRTRPVPLRSPVWKDYRVRTLRQRLPLGSTL